MTAFELGVDAFGRDDEICPFRADSDDGEEWLDGWNEAKEAASPELADNL